MRPRETCRSGILPIGCRLALLALTSLCLSTSAFADPPPPSPTGTAADPYRIVGNTGWWWDAREAGRGYAIEVNQATGKLFFASFLYSDLGADIWVAGNLTAQLSNVTAAGFYGPFTITTAYSGILYSYSGGQTLTGAYKAPASAATLGSVTITFAGPTAGTINWPAGVQSQTSQIVRFPIKGSTIVPANANIVPQSGWWWNPAEGGRGYFLETQGSSIFFAGYMYRGDGSNVWYLTQADFATGSLVSGPLTEYVNGPTFSAPTKSGASALSPIGTMQLTFSAPDRGSLTLGTGQVIPIQRFTAF